MAAKVRLEDGQQLGRDRHGPLAGVALRGAHDVLAADPHDDPVDPEPGVLDVAVTASQLGQLSEPQAAPRREPCQARYRSGRASTTTSTAPGLSTFVSCMLLAVPAPRTRQGLALTRSSATAVM